MLKFRILKFINNFYANLLPEPSIFDFYTPVMKRQKHIYDRTVIASNGFYGMEFLLRRYSGYFGKLNCATEHGGGSFKYNLDVGEWRDNNAPVLFVSSKERAKYIASYTNKLVIPFGTIINYARCIYNELTIKEIKQNLGKVLCVYPKHNTEDYGWCDTSEEFISYVKEFRHQYNYSTVIVCVYYVDIIRGLHFRYMKEGWIVVCSGYMFNDDYYDRAKTIIKISDYIVLQGYSSVLQHAIFMGVPVTIYQDFSLNLRSHTYDVDVEANNILREQFQTIGLLFKDHVDAITDNQFSFCKRFYGYDDVKKPEELRLLLDYISRIKPKMTKKQLLKIASRKKYDCIRKMLQEEIE